MKKNILIIILIISFVAVGGLSFYAGTKMSSNKSRINFQNGQTLSATGESSRTRSMSGMVNGEIAAISGDTVTVKLSSGSTKLVFVSDSTKVTKSEEGSISDLNVGDKVIVYGPSNTSGITAESITLGSLGLQQGSDQQQPQGPGPQQSQGN